MLDLTHKLAALPRFEFFRYIALKDEMSRLLREHGEFIIDDAWIKECDPPLDAVVLAVEFMILQAKIMQYPIDVIADPKRIIIRLN